MISISRRFFSLVGIVSGCIVMGLVFTMINTAIPVIQKNLRIPMHEMQWMMMAFGMINCALLVTSGRLADIYGRKKIYMIGLFSSCIGMILGGFSKTSALLITSMSFAGLGNAILLPVSQAMLVTEFPESQKGRAIGIWAASIAYAMALGPIMGGVIAEEIGWKWVFWTTIPFFVLSIFLVLTFGKESKNDVDPPQADYKGMLFIGVGLASFVVFASEFNHLSMALKGVLLFISLFSFFLLWKNSQTFPAPLLLPELVYKKVFLAASVGSACLIFYIWSIFFLFPIYLQNIRELHPLHSGLMMLGITIPVVILSPIVGRLYRPHRAYLIIFIGFLFLLASSLFQMYLDRASSIGYILWTISLFGIGYGLIIAPTSTAAISVVPPHKAGIASGTFVTFQEIGGTVGLALVVTAVRINPSLEEGLKQGGYAFFVVSIIGLIFSLLLKKRSKV